MTNPLFKSEPAKFIDAQMRTLDAMFESAFGQDAISDIVLRKDGLVTIQVNLAGFAKEDVNVEIDNDTVYVNAKNAKRQKMCECTIPGDVPAASIGDPTVVIDNGLLQVTFKGHDQKRPIRRKLPVK